MQRFLSIYAAVIGWLVLAGSVSAAEPALDRYGQPPQEMLTGGDWWDVHGILAPDEAKGHTGEFMLVKGKVVSTFKTREDLYLNFGEDYKTDFTVRIPKRAWKQFGEFDGKEITVRGVLRNYNGPMIVADFKEQIHAD